MGHMGRPGNPARGKGEPGAGTVQWVQGKERIDPLTGGRGSSLAPAGWDAAPSPVTGSELLAGVGDADLGSRPGSKRCCESHSHGAPFPPPAVPQPLVAQCPLLSCPGRRSGAGISAVSSLLTHVHLQSRAEEGPAVGPDRPPRCPRPCLALLGPTPLQPLLGTTARLGAPTQQHAPAPVQAASGPGCAPPPPHTQQGGTCPQHPPLPCPQAPPP